MRATIRNRWLIADPHESSQPFPSRLYLWYYGLLCVCHLQAAAVKPCSPSTNHSSAHWRRSLLKGRYIPLQRPLIKHLGRCSGLFFKWATANEVFFPLYIFQTWASWNPANDFHYPPLFPSFPFYIEDRQPLYNRISHFSLIKIISERQDIQSFVEISQRPISWRRGRHLYNWANIHGSKHVMMMQSK